MEFGTGDRVHVTRLDGEKVDFYATIGDLYQHGELIELVNCTDKSFKGVGVYLPNNKDFGPDKDDYYTLATDDEDSELSNIQHDKIIKDVEKLKEELEGYKKRNYELELAIDSDLKQQVDKWFNEWQDVKVENDLLGLELKDVKRNYRVVSDKYTKLTEHIKLKALHNPSISRYIDLVCFINEMEGK